MNSITSITPKQLRRAADIQERIQSLQQELNDLLGGAAVAEVAPSAGRGRGRGRRRMSAEGLANIRAAAQRRWAKFRAGRGTTAPKRRGRRRMSAASRARLAAVARARWAKVKSQGKSRL